MCGVRKVSSDRKGCQKYARVSIVSRWERGHQRQLCQGNENGSRKEMLKGNDNSKVYLREAQEVISGKYRRRGY